MPLTIFLQKLPNTIAIILSALLAYQLALFTWSLLPAEKSAVEWVAPETELENSAGSTDLATLKALNLFGQSVKPDTLPKKTPVPEVMGKTTLNLTLVGVVAASDPFYSSAIISYKGKQDSYFIDSKIEGTSASVQEIYPDRIVLDENGVYRILMLDGLEADVQQQNLQSRQPVSRTENGGSNQPTPVDLNRDELLKDPSKLTNYINISPVREDGEIKGYRVNPGKDPALFEQAGLENGDLVIELNGIDLTDMAESMSLLKEFPTMTEISLTVDREGQLYDLYLSIP
ncbi:type II secretion system protein GspC [Psychromonas sp.]|uniref:type II secretion system protein GspC n=1 Tax=Psychromonas sp. TaxID=1884585 RepID=UPI00356771F7